MRSLDDYGISETLTAHPRVGTRLEGRYRLRAPIGEGHFAHAWLADDEVTHSQVVVKCLKPTGPVAVGAARATGAMKLEHPSERLQSERAEKPVFAAEGRGNPPDSLPFSAAEAHVTKGDAARRPDDEATHRIHSQDAKVLRETVALRALRIPGVVRLLDQGHSPEGHPFLVLEYAEGHAFPGALSQLPWATLRPRAVRLLEVLGRIHANGIRHLDLKPDNVIVREPDGVLTLLDLGLADGAVLGAARPPDRMPEGNLRHRAPELRPGVEAEPSADLYGAGIMIRDALEHPIPPEVDTFLQRLHHRDPTQRFPDAWSALTALGLPLAQAPLLPGPVTVGALTALIEPESRFSRRREDFAQTLVADTGGDPQAIRAQLDHLLRTGDLTATATPHCYRLQREELRSGGLAHPVQRHAIQKALDRGAFREARTLIRTALLHTPTHAQGPLAHLGLIAALESHHPEALDEARNWLDRSGTCIPALAELADLARTIWLGGATPETFARLDHLWSVPRPFHRWIASLRLESLPTLKEQTAELARIRSRVGNDLELEVHLLDWQGRIAYLAGRYPEACTLHTAAAARAPGLDRELSAMSNTASALIELGQLTRARDLALDLRTRALIARHEFFTIRCEWLARVATWRLPPHQRDLHPDEALIEDIAGLSQPVLAGVAAVTEAIGAWKLGHHPTMRRLAQRALTLLPDRERNNRVVAQVLLEGHRPQYARGLIPDDLHKDLAWQLITVLALQPAGGPLRAEAVQRAAAQPEPERAREFFAPVEVGQGW